MKAWGSNPGVSNTSVSVRHTGEVAARVEGLQERLHAVAEASLHDLAALVELVAEHELGVVALPSLTLKQLT
ncbi:MAG: hypothetical protein IPM06_17080 [Rhizobiales bacterium]|nr:hypothetical protein [Hyphomicrobiales bacterium]